MTQGFRHEYKYLISRSAAELLKRRLPGIMERDPHAGETGQYTIRSLYFDDYSHSALDEKQDGINYRAKFRIRYYNYRPEILKLEKKEKLGNLTRKSAQRISLEEALSLERAEFPLTGTADSLAQELAHKCRNGCRPQVLVDYDRTPFICRDGNTRITLDENLRTHPYCTKLLGSHQAMIPVLHPDQVILEVKFDDFLPGHLDAALSDIPKAAMAISKFALCMNLK